ncbi:nucleotidyl transferase AbiEii/AbiGii toxin family protein [Helicobacter sp. T3_23-1059]
MLKDYQIQRLAFMQEILGYVGDNFILKGGTALRFYYGLDRYSEDLDFDSISSNMDITKCLKKHKDFNSWQIYEKKITDSSLRLTIDYGAKSDLGIYPLKIDISGRDKIRLRNNLLKYSTINGVNVYDIETLVDLKSTAFCQRDKIRDFYDIGFLLEKYPQCFDDKTLANIATKIMYSGKDELNAQLMIEAEEHSLIERNDIEIVCDYADKILQNIDEIQNAKFLTQNTNNHNLPIAKPKICRR